MAQDTDGLWFQASSDTRTISRVLSIAEPLFLLAGVSLLVGQLAPLMGLATRGQRNALLFGEGGPHWIGAAIAETEWLGFRFGLTLLTAWLVCVWRRGPTRREASISTGGHSLIKLIGIGIAVSLVMMMPVRVAMAIDVYVPLGDRTPMWDLIASSEWSWEFWLFMAASSFALVPVVEELFFRAYLLGRLRENFTPGGATLLSAVVFWVSHGQYLTGDPYLTLHSVSAFLGAVVMAWMTLRTGSIVPALAAHVVFNLPGQFAWHVGWVLAALVVLVAWRHTAQRYLLDLLRLIASTREWVFLAVLGAALAALAMAARMSAQVAYALAGAFLLLFLTSLARRRRL